MVSAFVYAILDGNSHMTAGSLDYEKEDAESFASWGVDYLKYDNCYHMGRWGTPLLSFNRYKVMWDALKAAGRPMLYSLCSWGEDYVHTVSWPVPFDVLALFINVWSVGNVNFQFLENLWRHIRLF